MPCVTSCSIGFMTFRGPPPARYSITYMETHADVGTSMNVCSHFHSVHIHTQSHTCCSALCQAVTAVWHRLSCLIISFSERCPVPSTKTNMAGGDESINQMRHLPIVMFHLQLMFIEWLRKFPIMREQHSQSASPRTVWSMNHQSQIDCCQNRSFVWLMIVIHTDGADAPLSGTQHCANVCVNSFLPDFNFPL